MHPNPAFRSDDRALLEALIEEIGFGMIFAQTPDGPRVAHVPIVSTGDGAIQFHLSNGNALTRHLAEFAMLVAAAGEDDRQIGVLVRVRIAHAAAEENGGGVQKGPLAILHLR